MKNSILLAFCMMILCVGTVHADNDLNPAQTRLRDGIQTFLRSEGYVPEIDSDGDIKFKKEGALYYVALRSADVEPMYAVLFRIFNYPEGYSKETIKLATGELNLYKGVKVLCYDSSVRIGCDMFLRDVDTFKYAFDKMLEQIGYVVGDFIDECDKVKNAR